MIFVPACLPLLPATVSRSCARARVFVSWHHKYPFDYAASEYGVLQQFNPTKLIIDICASVGLVTDRKRATGMWKREKAKHAAAEQAAKAE